MIEYLEKLIEEKEYGKAVTFAEQLLRNRDSSASDLLAIQSAILAARLMLNQYGGAVVAGQVAVKLAGELHDWDRFGVACYDLGTAYYHLGQVAEAMDAWFQYLSRVSMYRGADRFEANVRFNLGFAYTAEGHFAPASAEYTKAIEAAHRLGDDRLAHFIRQALVGALLKSGDLAGAPRLLAQCQRYLGNNQGAPELHGSRLWQLKLRVEYTMLTSRPLKARTLALHGLEQSEGKPAYQFMFHMMLARLAQRHSVPQEALGHAIAARVYASRFQLYDLETEAADMMYEITQGNPRALQDWEQSYLLDSLGPPQGM